MTAPCRIERVSWSMAGERLAAIRKTVFVAEQGVPQELEWDGLDEDARHVLAVAPDGSDMGCGRLVVHGERGKIGRMAVLDACRGRGVGSALLRELLAVAADLGLSEVGLDAQTHALDFYAAHGFVPVGDVFLDAGIPHRHMLYTFGARREGRSGE